MNERRQWNRKTKAKIVLEGKGAELWIFALNMPFRSLCIGRGVKSFQQKQTSRFNRSTSKKCIKSFFVLDYPELLTYTSNNSFYRRTAMSNQQEYPNTESKFFEEIDNIMYQYYFDEDNEYVFKNEEKSCYHSDIELIISNLSPKHQTYVDYITYIINKIYNDNRDKYFSISADNELYNNGAETKIIVTVSTNNGTELHNFLVETFMPALSVLLSNYIPNRDDIKTKIMKKIIRKKIYDSSQKILLNLAIKEKIDLRCAGKISDILLNILWCFDKEKTLLARGLPKEDVITMRNTHCHIAITKHEIDKPELKPIPMSYDKEANVGRNLKKILCRNDLPDDYANIYSSYKNATKRESKRYYYALWYELNEFFNHKFDTANDLGMQNDECQKIWDNNHKEIEEIQQSLNQNGEQETRMEM